MRNTSALVAALGFLAFDAKGSDALAGDRVIPSVLPIPRASTAVTKGLDISVYSGNITSGEVQNWMSQGITHLVVGSQNYSVAREQLATAVAGGMTVDVYVYLYFTSSMTTQVNGALSIASGYPVGRIWLDIEDGPSASGFSVSTLTGKIQDAINACGTMPVGIYSSSGWWNHYMGGSTAFSSVPLWFAHWDNVGSLDTWAWQSFGGWSSPVGKQYQGDVTVGGVGADTDVFSLSSIGSGSSGGGESSPPASSVHIGSRHESQNLAHRCGCSTIDAPGSLAPLAAIAALALLLLRRPR